MPPVAVMSLVDSLALGGTERAAVSIVNYLPPERYRAILCTTRGDGALAPLVATHVERLCLARQSAADHIPAIRRLARYIRDNDVRLLHAHSSSVFLARAAAVVAGRASIVWHAHFGKVALEDRAAWLYRAATARAGAAIAVNADLEAWIRRRLLIREDRVFYLPNIAALDEAPPAADLPGVPGKRVVCIANIRPEKDHVTLVRAMALVLERHPQAHLLLVGAPRAPESVAALEREIDASRLRQAVTWLGARADASAILRASDVAVLSSVTEGLPVSLLEYGMAGLPVAATQVGQNAEVLDGGRAGILAPPRSPEALAAALIRLLDDAALRSSLGRALRERVESVYGPGTVIRRLTSIYDTVLADSSAN